MKNFTFAGVSSANRHSKLSAIWLFVLLSLFGFKANAQLIGTESVDANFGIDADFYSNLLQNGTFSVPASGTDDWFLQAPGTGSGVIDTFGAAAMRAYFASANRAQRNITFTRSQSVNFNSIVNGRRWIDALYGRDNNSSGGNSDSSVFAGTADKNYFNPRNWNLGSGGTPAKNDIIDVLAHLRRDGTDPQSSTLWGYGAATVVSPNGDDHVDFEYFRKNISYTPGNSTFTGNSGIDSGHTAWTFAADGRVITPGDIIFSFDFQNGGTVPVLSIRAWVDPAALPGGNFAGFNATVNRPFTFTGVFNTDASGSIPSAPFGYAEIRANDNTQTYAHARVNLANQTIDATPFGFLSGPQAVYVTDNEPLTFMEFSINLTAFGLDAAVTQNNPCAVLFGSLLVKSRSSTSFTAELKDFAGPYEFGRRIGAAFTLSATPLTCTTNATTSLTNMQPAAPATTITWSGAGLVNGQGTTTATWSAGGWKYVSVLLNGTLCAKTDSVFVTSNTTPPNVSIDPALQLTCTRQSVTLTAHSTTPGATFAWSGGGTGSTKSVSAQGDYSVTATDPANGCTASATVHVSQNITPPNVGIDPPGTLTCTNTSVTLHATSTTPGATYAWSGGGTSANKTVFTTGPHTVTVTDPATGCTASMSVTVPTDNSAITASIAPALQLTCSRTSVTLTASSSSGDATFAWSGGGTGNQRTVSAMGTYTVTATDGSSGCQATATVFVDQNITPPNLTIDFPLPITCSRTSVTLMAHSTTPGATFAWGGGPTGPSKVVTGAGTYTVTATDPANSCTNAGSVGVIEDKTPPVAEAGAGGTLSCTVLTLTLDGTGSTPGMQYLWSASNGGHIASGGTGLHPVIDEAGTYTIRVTNPSNGCTATDVATVDQIHDLPTCNLPAPIFLPPANSTGNTLTATLSNYSTAVWSVTSLDGSWSITNDDGNGTITYTAGNAGVLGTFKVVLSNQPGTCKDSCIVSFFAASGDVFCGMTQGFYGNYNGKYCDMRSKDQLLKDILGTPLTVGITGVRSLTFDSSRRTCVIERLPAGGPPDMLPPNNGNQLPANMTFTASCGTTPFTIPLKNGRFRNVFLGQTITLGLNLRLGGLSSLRLTDNWLITAGVASGPNNLICDNPGQPVITGSERYYHIPQSVLDYLGVNNTVYDLFVLANQSLAGIGPNSPSRSDINEAVSAINEGFDGCRRFIGFSETGPPSKTDEPVSYEEEFYDENLNFQASVNVYPNPFTSSTFIQYTPVETSNVKIEVIDATGRLMTSVYEGLVESGMTYESTVDGSKFANGLYIVRISTENYSLKKQIVLQR